MQTSYNVLLVTCRYHLRRYTVNAEMITYLIQLNEKQCVLLYIQTSFSFLIGQHTPVNSQLPASVASFLSNTVNYWTEMSQKIIIGR